MTPYPSYSQDATIEYQGHIYYLSAIECRAVEDEVNRWHGQGDPSTWLTVAVFELARRKIAGAPDAVTLELAAKVLGLTVSAVTGKIEWHEQYMRWHDDDPDYRVLSGT